MPTEPRTDIGKGNSKEVRTQLTLYSFLPENKIKSNYDESLNSLNITYVLH